ncbi:MAG: hypothetical protein M0R17_07140 [Candidatus Omnitrophica bacterium]|jgi:hypothetical protein|nr:hypothetical protein [Candidatus Omnitrophota bacterium]
MGFNSKQVIAVIVAVAVVFTAIYVVDTWRDVATMQNNNNNNNNWNQNNQNQNTGSAFSAVNGTCGVQGQIMNENWLAVTYYGGRRTGDSIELHAVPATYANALGTYDYENSQAVKTTTVASTNGTEVCDRTDFKNILNQGKIPVLYTKPSGFEGYYIDLRDNVYSECRQQAADFGSLVEIPLSVTSTYKIVETDLDFATISANASYRSYVTIIGSVMPEGNRYPVWNIEDLSGSNEVDAIKVIYKNVTYGAEFANNDTDNFFFAFKNGLSGGTAEIQIQDNAGAMATGDVNVTLITYNKPTIADVNIFKSVVGSTIDTVTIGTVSG